MRRRDFLKAAGAVGGAAALGGTAAWILDDDDGTDETESVLDHPASECPVDTIVVLMLENRSFDHYYGWLGADEAYLEAGRRRHGRNFRIAARNKLEYPKPDGSVVATQHLPGLSTEPDPYRGCGHPIPGHGWFAGRAERDRGFLGVGTGNDDFAIGYYRREDLPVHTRLAERFTVFDHYHSSLLAGTFPNRYYQHAAQSYGSKEDPVPLRLDSVVGTNIWDRLAAANVPATYYYTDLPVLLLWGERMTPFIRPIDQFFADAAAGTLPRVVFVDPGFLEPLRTDDHPLGDIRLGQRFLREIFANVARSPHWKRTAFFLVYDEWGGFFDHVPPVVLPDVRASANDDDNFGQAGFRVPAVLASPYGLRGGVDHRVYDHTSILRFIEWRFLGAPAEGPGKRGDKWFLTKRDRFANNIGRSLRPTKPELDLHYDANVPISPFSLGCAEPQIASAEALLEVPDPFAPSEELSDYLGKHFPRPTLTPWIEDGLQAILRAPQGDERGVPPTSTPTH
jgi:phospholipase C